MRVTVSHTRPKQDVIGSVDRAFDDLFKGIGIIPLQIVNERRTWTGSRLTFAFDAKMGIISVPIKGTVEVTDRDVTIDADLGWLEKLIPSKQAGAVLEKNIKGLLE